MHIQDILAKYEATPDKLLNILHDIQNQSEQSYISESDISALAKYLNTTKAAIYGVVEYYSMFSAQPRGKYVIRVCKSPICRMLGGQDMLNFIQSALNIPTNETDAEKLFTLEVSECLGHCDKAPVMMVNDELHVNLTPEKIDSILSQYRQNKTKKL
jgi:NADH-quinone oxidoreductase subunit E